MEASKLEEYPEWDIIPLEVKIKILKKERCFGDIDGNRPECNRCLIRQECLLASFHNFLKAYDVWLKDSPIWKEGSNLRGEGG